MTCGAQKEENPNGSGKANAYPRNNLADLTPILRQIRPGRRQQMRPILHLRRERIARKPKPDRKQLRHAVDSPQQLPSPVVARRLPLLLEILRNDRRRTLLRKVGRLRPLAHVPEEAPLRVLQARLRVGHRLIRLGEILGEFGVVARAFLEVRRASNLVCRRIGQFRFGKESKNAQTYLIEELRPRILQLSLARLRKVALHHVDEAGRVRLRHARVLDDDGAIVLERERDALGRFFVGAGRDKGGYVDKRDGVLERNVLHGGRVEGSGGVGVERGSGVFARSQSL